MICSIECSLRSLQIKPKRYHHFSGCHKKPAIANAAETLGVFAACAIKVIIAQIFRLTTI
jgi:hypothetical protein